MKGYQHCQRHEGCKIASRDRNLPWYVQLGARLGRIGVQLEKAFNGAQDVEGAIVDDSVYIVQSRPQP